jgi:hypothetical protein
MADWGPWNLVTYGKNRRYKRLQRGRRVPWKKSPETQYIYLPTSMAVASDVLGAVDNAIDTVGKIRRRRRSLINQAAIGLFGNRDNYDRPYDSLLNRHKAQKEKEKAAQRVDSPVKGAQHGALAREAVSPIPNAPSTQPDTPIAPETPSASETK